MARAVSTSAFTPSRIIILTLLISIILLTVTQDQIASAIHAVARPRTCSPFPSSSTDEQKLAPDLRHIPRTFRHIKHLEDLSQEADEEWRATLSTPKGGFLFVENKNKEEREGKDEPWGISMFHAVHCLTMLRSSFQTFMGNGTTTTMNGHAHHQDPRLVKSGQYEAQDAMHVGHCFSYIAQVSPISNLIALLYQRLK
ncbi:hypothetical protein BJ878DRAFT_72959 [Calycina marina]|uniref:Uncharacterized protein n=1 Tax=Calycina marina TaxID=1763456 RepID=A0A9P7Z3U8_9HELO|nr:hypothetical protein BJ878DRAFT_72959 [Calycina marina]